MIVKRKPEIQEKIRADELEAKEQLPLLSKKIKKKK